MPIVVDRGQITRLDGQVVEQIAHCPAEPGMDQIRCDVAHRDEHEPSLVLPHETDPQLLKNYIDAHPEALYKKQKRY